MEEDLMTLNGQSVRGVRNFDVINPATEEIISTVPECSDEQLDTAVNAANHSLTAWAQDVAKRRQALNNCAEVLLSNIDSLAKLITEEQGKPLRDSNREIRRSAELIMDFAKLDLRVAKVLQAEK